MYKQHNKKKNTILLILSLNEKLLPRSASHSKGKVYTKNGRSIRLSFVNKRHPRTNQIALNFSLYSNGVIPTILTNVFLKDLGSE